MRFSKIIELVKSKFILHQEIGKYLSWNLFYRVLVVITTLIAGVLVSREIGDSNRGIYQLFFTSLMLFHSFLNFGLNASAVYYVNKDKEKVRSYISNNLIVTLLSSIAIMICILVMSDRLHLQSQSLKYVFILCYFAYSFNTMYRSFLIGIHENLFLMKLDFYLRFSYLALILFLYFIDRLSLNSIFGIYTCELLIYSYVSYRKIGVNFIPIRLDLELAKESVFFNLKSYIGWILIFLILRSDQYLIKYLMNNASVGIYGVGSTVIENLAIIASTLSTIYLPKFLDIDDFNIVLKKTNKLLLVIFSTSLGIAIVIYFLAPFIVNFFLKREDVEGVLSLRILLVGYLFWSMFSMLSMIYLAKRFKKSVLLILGFIIILNLSMNYQFIPRYGISAAAVVSSSCYTLLFILCYIDLFYLKKRNNNRLQSN